MKFSTFHFSLRSSSSSLNTLFLGNLISKRSSFPEHFSCNLVLFPLNASAPSPVRQQRNAIIASFFLSPSNFFSLNFWKYISHLFARRTSLSFPSSNSHESGVCENAFIGWRGWGGKKVEQFIMEALFWISLIFTLLAMDDWLRNGFIPL